MTEEETVEQRFGIMIKRTIDKKTKRMHVEMKTKGEGIPLSEVIIILEGWMKKVKDELQKPFAFDKMKFISEEEKRDRE